MFRGYIFLKPVSCNDTTRLQTQKSERKSTRRFCRIMPILLSYAGNVRVCPKDLTPCQRHSKALSKAIRSLCFQQPFVPCIHPQQTCSVTNNFPKTSLFSSSKPHHFDPTFLLPRCIPWGYGSPHDTGKQSRLLVTHLCTFKTCPLAWLHPNRPGVSFFPIRCR
jgi:hypothetical protein